MLNKLQFELLMSRSLMLFVNLNDINQKDWDKQVSEAYEQYKIDFIAAGKLSDEDPEED